MVSPPGLFSTTTACFQRFASPSPTIRAAASGEMPGPNGVMIRTVRSGHVSDRAGRLARIKHGSNRAAVRRYSRRSVLTTFSSLVEVGTAGGGSEAIAPKSELATLAAFTYCMNRMHIDQLDITQIRLLAALSQSGSLSKAAQQVGVSQSAASHALAKLRRQLGDPLFTRTRSGFQPTPFGTRVSTASCEAMDLLSASLASNDRFDPQTSSRAFRFYMNDVGQTVFFPRLLPFLKVNAPLV